MIAFLDNTQPAWGGLTISSHQMTGNGVITISGDFSYATNLPAFHDDFITEFVRKLRVRMAQLLLWSRMAATELRRLQLQLPLRIVPLPRQNRCWRRRVCASSQRWRVWVP